MSTRAYDTFKTIVAVILFVLLLWGLLSDSLVPAVSSTVPTANPDLSSGAEVSPTTAPSTTLPVAARSTTNPEPTATAEPTPTATAADLTSAQPTIDTQTGTPLPASADCPLALPTRLNLGDTARVTTHLHLRTEAGIGNQLILTNLPGTELTIIGGPVCAPYHRGAYLWWQVSLPNDQTGWSAEGSSSSNFYFLEPVE